jgi:uncharacterized protein YdcH (DUF465 family)
MGLRDDELKARLLAENDEFRRCDDRLGELTRKAFLSNDEQMEERTLKKQKLHLKDRMESIKTRFSADVARIG